MQKKRGKLRAIVILGFGIIIAVLFLAIFFGSRQKEKEESYILSHEERAMFDDLANQVLILSYPECVAFAERNLSLCEGSDNNEDRLDCISYISMIKAKKEGNEKYCDEISSENVKEYCKEFVSGKLNCNSLPQNDKQYCMALQNQDVSFCNELDANTKDYCKSEVGLIVASVNEDIEKCKNISLSWILDYCNAWISENSQICQKEPVKTEQILQTMGVKLKKPEICGAINKTKQRDMCFLSFAPAYNNTCSNINTKDIKNACESMMKKDKEECLKVQDYSAKAICSMVFVQE
jgi:hypothetical protein